MCNQTIKMNPRYNTDINGNTTNKGEKIVESATVKATCIN